MLKRPCNYSTSAGVGEFHPKCGSEWPMACQQVVRRLEGRGKASLPAGQLRDTERIANRSGKKYIVTRASTAKKLVESGRSGLYNRALQGKVAIIGFLRG